MDFVARNGAGKGGSVFSRRDLTRLILPLLIEQLLGMTIGVADTVMVASCGEAAVSGVSLVDSVNLLLLNVFAALATGGAIIASQYLGREDRENACTAAAQLVIATGALSAVIMAVCLIGNGPLLRLIFGKTDAEIMKNCTVYFFWSALSYPFIALYNAGAALFRAMGNSRVSMVASAVMNTVNILGNALLIFGFGWGVAGAAIATLISRVLGAGLILFLLRNRQNSIHLGYLFPLRIRPGMIKSILRIGVPNGVENGVFHVGKILVQSIVSTFSQASIAALAVANSITSFITIPSTAIGLAMIPVVGRCVGAGDRRAAKRYAFGLLGVAYAGFALVGLTALALLPLLPGIFNLSPEAGDILRRLILIFVLFGTVLHPASFTQPNSLRAGGDVRFTMIVSIFSMCVFRLGMSYLLIYSFHMDVMGVWYAMIADWAVRGAVFTARALGGKWLEKRVV